MTRVLVSLLAVRESTKVEPSASNSAPPRPMPTKLVCQHHTPPPGVDYSQNPSVFGKILRGESPAIVLDESLTLLAFQDRTPRADFHALVIPKQFIPTVASLTKENVPVLQEMRDMALDILQLHQPNAFRHKDYILCFHLPPFNSVDHLHLHVLAPASKMNWLYRYGKYQVGTPWCADEAVVRQRLSEEKAAM